MGADHVLHQKPSRLPELAQLYDFSGASIPSASVQVALDVKTGTNVLFWLIHWFSQVWMCLRLLLHRILLVLNIGCVVYALIFVEDWSVWKGSISTSTQICNSKEACSLPLCHLQPYDSTVCCFKLLFTLVTASEWSKVDGSDGSDTMYKPNNLKKRENCWRRSWVLMVPNDWFL